VLDDDSTDITRRVSGQGRGGADVKGLPVTIATRQKRGERRWKSRTA